MLTSISPLGERARASRWWLTTLAYVVSSVVGGLALGLLAALVGSLLPASWRSSPAAYLLLAVVLVVGLLLDLGVAGRRLPTWRRQVDQAWLGRYRGWVVGVGFGAQLGFGLVTIITSATTYAVALLCLLSGDPAVGLRGRRHLRAGAGPPVGVHGPGRHPRAALAGAVRCRGRRARGRCRG